MKIVRIYEKKNGLVSVTLKSTLFEYLKVLHRLNGHIGTPDVNGLTKKELQEAKSRIIYAYAQDVDLVKKIVASSRTKRSSLNDVLLGLGGKVKHMIKRNGVWKEVERTPFFDRFLAQWDWDEPQPMNDAMFEAFKEFIVEHKVYAYKFLLYCKESGRRIEYSTEQYRELTDLN